MWTASSWRHSVQASIVVCGPPAVMDMWLWPCRRSRGRSGSTHHRSCGCLLAAAASQGTRGAAATAQGGPGCLPAASMAAVSMMSFQQSGLVCYLQAVAWHKSLGVHRCDLAAACAGGPALGSQAGCSYGLASRAVTLHLTRQQVQAPAMAACLTCSCSSVC